MLTLIWERWKIILHVVLYYPASITFFHTIKIIIITINYIFFQVIKMIYINKGQTNDFALTLTESTTISNPYFLFKFVWEMDESLTPLYWVGNDTSSYPDRFNLFTLVEGVNGDVEFRIGQYRYEVYESVSNPTDETGLDKIEEGRLVVNGTGSTIYD